MRNIRMSQEYVFFAKINDNKSLIMKLDRGKCRRKKSQGSRKFLICWSDKEDHAKIAERKKLSENALSIS